VAKERAGVPPLTAPFLAAAVLVAVAGGFKLRRPRPTAQALRTQGLPGSTGLVRLLGAVELGVAAAAALGTTAGAAGLALLYASFTAFVLLALVRRRPLSSCGCFGSPDTPPSGWHVTVTSAFAVCAAAAVVVGPAVGLPALAAAGAVAAVSAAAGTALVAFLAWAVLSELPAVTAAAARRPAQEPAHPALFQITAPRSSAP
jgi:hypothetical protein